MWTTAPELSQAIRPSPYRLREFYNIDVLRQFTTDDALTLSADAWGNEDHCPVLLLHGGGQTRHSWKRTAHTLADLGYYAVALDLRAHGKSDWSSAGAYNLDRYVADLSLVVHQLARRPIIIGASLGGIVAMLYAGEDDRSRLSCLVLVDIATRIEDAGVSRIKTFLLAHRDGFTSLEQAGQAVADYLKHRNRSTVLAKGLEKNLRRGADGKYYWHWDPALLESPLLEEVRDEARLLRAVKRIKVPLLLVRGAQSDIVSPEITRQFLQQVPHASYVEVGGAGHTLAGDCNDEFTEAVVAFLKQQQTPGSNPHEISPLVGESDCL